MRKIILFLSLLLFLPLLLWGNDINDMMILNMKDSSVRYFKLAAKPEVTFTGSEIMIVASDKETQCSVNAADVMHFSFGSSAAIGEATGDAVVFSFDDKTLTVKGLAEGDNLHVYNMSDIQIGHSKAGSEGIVVFDISALPKGIYAVKAAGMSFKIYR